MDCCCLARLANGFGVDRTRRPARMERPLQGPGGLVSAARFPALKRGLSGEAAASGEGTPGGGRTGIRRSRSQKLQGFSGTRLPDPRRNPVATLRELPDIPSIRRAVCRTPRQRAAKPGPTALASLHRQPPNDKKNRSFGARSDGRRHAAATAAGRGRTPNPPRRGAREKL